MNGLDDGLGDSLLLFLLFFSFGFERIMGDGDFVLFCILVWE